MARVAVGDLEFAVERFGDPGRPPILLVQGLAQQLIDWPWALIEALAAIHHVVVFDNRDTGLSAKFGPCRSDQEGTDTPYTLFDMAADTAGLIDALGLGRVHLLGYSMGGRIAQIVAARHPDRVRSLTCLMSSGGQAGVLAAPHIREALGAARPPELLRAPDIDLFTRQAALFEGDAWVTPEAELRARIAAAVARGYCPLGSARRIRAIGAAGDRSNLLRRITAPTLFIHGSADPVVPVEAARAGAALIPGARIEVIAGLGHNLSSTAAAAAIPPLLGFLGGLEATAV